MVVVYILLFALWSYLCYYIGKRLKRANEDDERISDISRADDIIGSASIEFDRLYKDKSNK